MDWFREVMLAEGKIGAEDMNLLMVSDDPMAVITRNIPRIAGKIQARPAEGRRRPQTARPAASSQKVRGTFTASATR